MWNRFRTIYSKPKNLRVNEACQEKQAKYEGEGFHYCMQVFQDSCTRIFWSKRLIKTNVTESLAVYYLCLQF